MKHRDRQSEFRRWIVDRVKESHFMVLREDTLEAVARRIGVQPDVLVQAQKEKATEMAALGRLPTRIGSTRRSSGSEAVVQLMFPEEIFPVFVEAAKIKGFENSELVRSIIHTLLLGPDNPRWCARGWYYQGHMYRIRAATRLQYRCKSHITRGADVALGLRARQLGVTRIALVRGAVIDFLEGRMNVICHTDLEHMWDDPRRYWTGELIRKGLYNGHGQGQG